MAKAKKAKVEYRVWWTITVLGYGAFQYFGTEDEAEEMREHKAEWEGGKGTKRIAKTAEVKQGRQDIIEHHLHQANFGVLDEREQTAYEEAVQAAHVDTMAKLAKIAKRVQEKL